MLDFEGRTEINLATDESRLMYLTNSELNNIFVEKINKNRRNI